MNLRRILALLLTVLMVVSALPLNAIAEEMMIANLEELIAAIEEPAVEEVVSELPEEETAVEPSAPVEEEAEGQEMQTLSMEDVALLLAEEEGAVEETVMPEIYAEGAGEWNDTYTELTFHGTPTADEIKAAVLEWGNATNPSVDTVCSYTAPIVGSGTREIELSWEASDALKDAEISVTPAEIKNGTKYTATAVFKDVGFDITIIRWTVKAVGSPVYTHSFTLKIYDNLTVNTTKDGEATTTTTKVYRDGQAVTVEVPTYDGYDVTVTGAEENAEGVWVVAEKGLTADANVSIVYTKKEAKKYNVTLEVKGDEYGDASLSASGELEANTPVIVTVEPEENTDNTKYSVSVAVDGATLDENNSFVVGETDVKVTVTFTKDELTANAAADIEYSADIAKIEAEILKNLGVQYNGADVTSATVEYYAATSYEDNNLYGDWFDLDAVEPKYNLDVFGYPVELPLPEFAADGVGSTEKIRVTYDGLFIEATIKLVDLRTAPETVISDDRKLLISGYAPLGWQVSLAADAADIAAKVAAMVSVKDENGELDIHDGEATVQFQVVNADGEATWYDCDAVNLGLYGDSIVLGGTGTFKVAFGTGAKYAATDFTDAFTVEIVDSRKEVVIELVDNEEVDYSNGIFYAITWDEEEGVEDKNTLEIDAVTKALKVTYPDGKAQDENGDVDAVVKVEGLGTEDEKPVAYVTVESNEYYAGVTKKAFPASFEVYEYTITFYDVDGTTILDKQEEVVYGTTPVYTGEELEKENYVASWVPAIVPAVANAEYTLKWLPANDLNENGIADEEELGTLKVTVENADLGTYAVSGGYKLFELGNDTYAVLMNANEDATEVTITATANKSTDASKFYYVDEANTTKTVEVTKGEEVTATVTFAVDELAAASGNTVKVNFYSAETKAAGLKGKILDAAKLSGDITVELYVSAEDAAKIAAIKINELIGYDLIPADSENVESIIDAVEKLAGVEIGGFMDIEKGKVYTVNLPLLGEREITISGANIREFILENETENVRFTKNGEKNGETYTLTAEASVKFEELRQSAPLTNVAGDEITFTTATEVDNYVETLKAKVASADVMAKATVTTESKLPTVDGNSANMVYAVSYDADANYLANTASITFKATFKATDAILKVTASDAYTVKVNGTEVASGDVNLKVPANEEGATQEQTIVITPAKGKIIEGITVYEGEDDATKTNVGATVAFEEGVATATFAIGYPETKTIYTFEVKVADEETYGFKFVEGAEYDYVYVPGKMAEERDVYNAVVVSPALPAKAEDDAADGVEFTVEYKAREAGKVKVTLTENLKIELVSGLPAVELPIAGEYEITLNESWRSVGDPVLPSETPDQVVQRVAKNLLASPEQILDKISMDDILNAIRNQDYSGISDEVMGVIEAAIQEDLKNFEARNFGEGADSENAVVEELRLTYKNNQYALDYDYTTVKVSDIRKETQIVVPETVTVTYGQYDEAAVKAALAPVVKAGDEVVAGAEVVYSYLGDSIEGLNASEDGYTINLSYAGGEGYKASFATAKLIVKKAKIETFDYDSQIVTYGTPYTFELVNSAADAEVIEFIVGVDVAKANIAPDGLSGILPEVWVELPQSIMDLVDQLNSYLPDELKFSFSAGGYELGKFFDLLERVADYAADLEGNTLDMGTVTTLLTKLTEIMDTLGVDNMIVYVNQGYPQDIGVYIAGAVSADTNYETAYTADYLLIVPEVTEAELSWLYNDDNFIVTLPVVKENADYLKAEANIDLSEHEAKIEYLYIGYDANGEFRLITNDTTTFTENDYGAYVQIAYILKWANEAVYAMPIVRPLVIVPELYTVTFEDANENNIRVFEFDNTSKAMNVKVTDQAGKDVTDDVELNVRYIGMKTNTETYNETTGPKNAGAYAVVVTAIGRENGVVVGAGMNVGAMVITPTESEITVIKDDNHVRLQSKLPEGGLAVADLVEAKSTVTEKDPTYTPDYTTITGTVNIDNVTKDGKLLENINGNVNVDLPEWVYRNDFLPERLKDGVTAAGLSAALKEAVAKVNGNAVAPLSLEDDLDTAKNAMDLLGIDASELAAAVQSALDKLGADVDVSGVKSALEVALEQLDTTADVSDMAAAIQEALAELGTKVDFADAVSAAQTALDKLGVNITTADIAGFVQTALKQLGKNVDISNAPAFVQDALKQLADYVETADVAGIIKEALDKIGTNADYSDVAESIQKALEEMNKGADIANMTGFVQKIMEELAKKVDMSDLEAATQKALEEMGVNVDVAAVSDAISSILADVDMKSDFVDMAGALIEVLDKIPSNLNVTFENDQHLKNIGAYAVIGVVTDSDHIPSVDADYLLITPAIAEITFKDANNNNQILHTYNGKRQGVEVESINIVPTGVANWDALKITYTGIESAIDIEGNEMVNTPAYHSELAPIETGAYLVTATYCDVADGTIKAVGIELGVMVIAPAEADIAVNGGIFTEPVKVADIVETTPATGVETTVITTGISVNKETEKVISEAIATGKVPSVKDMQGNVAYVNVDLPAWVDAALEVMGVDTEGTLEISVLKEKVSVLAKLYAKAKEIAREQTTGKAAMAAGVLASIAGINAEEALEILKKVDDNVEEILAKLIEVLEQYGTTIEVTLKDVEDQEALANKGLYLVTAIVTDTDYLPAIDTDFVVITPAIADISFVDGNNNNLFRRVYNGKPQEIKAEVTMKPATVAVNPKALKITYTGIESAIDFEGKEMVNTPFYHSTVAPTQTGAYLVTAFYYDANEDGTVKGVGIELGKLVILPDAAGISVNGGVFNAPVKAADLVEVTQDNGEGFDPETTVITTGISVSGATEKAILAAIAKGEAPAIKDIYGNAAHVYADLPAWVDAALEVMGIDTDKPVEIQTLSATIAEIEELYAKAKDIAREKTDGEAAIAAGIVATVLGIEAVEVLDILKDVDDNIEAVLAKLVEVLNKYEPTLKVSLQEVEDQAALETGLYLVTAMVTDTDYLPAFDSDFVLISKVAAKVEIDSKIVTYDGKNQPVSVYVNGVLTNSENLDVRYTGVQTDGKTVTNSATAPKYAGVYAVTARYAEFSKDGSELVAFGADVGMLVIEPKALEMNFAPAKNIHLYDGTEKAPVADITCCEESGQYKTIITAVKVNETTVNLNVSDEFVAQVKGIINALDETYDAAAAKLPEEAKNMIKAMAALAGITREDVEQLKKMVKDATSDNVQIDDYDIGGLKVIAKLLSVTREQAKELVLALDSNVEALINFVMSDEDADLVLHYAEIVALKLASFSAQVVGQINDMINFIEREIEEGAAKVTFNENPTEIGVYPVVALGYLNSDHYISVAKGQMEIRDLFDIQAARMHLASALAMEFAWFQSDIIEGKDYYLQVTKTYGDGRPDRVVKVPMSQWGVDGKYYFAGIDKLPAKGMADTMYAQVFFADGTAASTVWVDSVRDYAMRILATTESDKSKTLMVDMLNYGAAAQTYFDYNEADLANNQLSDDQKAFATGEVELTNNLVKGEGYVASALQLQDYIKLNVKFNNIDSTMKAYVSYTNHYGVEKEMVIDGSDFEDGNIIVINHDLAAADFRQLITCVVKDANGEEVTRVVESVESYLCRLSQYNTLYGMVAKYTAAAYSYFH